MHIHPCIYTKCFKSYIELKQFDMLPAVHNNKINKHSKFALISSMRHASDIINTPIDYYINYILFIMIWNLSSSVIFYFLLHLILFKMVINAFWIDYNYKYYEYQLGTPSSSRLNWRTGFSQNALKMMMMMKMMMRRRWRWRWWRDDDDDDDDDDGDDDMMNV